MVPIPMRRRSPCALPSLLFTLLLVAQAHAQSPAPTRPDPLDPRAQVPSVRYESSFAQFRRIGDDKPVAWREANDAVARIGGWRVYAREAQQPDPATAEKPAAPSQAPASAPAPAAPPMPAGHSGHKH
ncbi:hypothetical protein [Aquincola sp. J276]|uniref:hypothetical protein n=1 Tax=Aquincola sp. J276 TaxID=2898432 RepID=UPI0021508EA5|nr:hypothetical protein [Aquincola sp. J276]MCR5864609.1 hypothetical protein [Aquincola sp. J276]